MVGGVAIGVHRHKAGVLQKARVNTPASARKAVRHRENDVFLEPLIAARRGQVVHLGRRAARIDRAAHHRHRQRRGFAASGHQGHGRQHRHRGLTDADYVAVAVLALQMADKFLNVVDVVVEVKFTLGQWHQTCIGPVGDVDLVVFEHGAHRIAQQRGVVARQRRYDQHHRLIFQLAQGAGVVGEALETAQLAKRFVQLNALVDSHANAIDIYGSDAKHWLFVALAQAVRQVVASRNALRQRRFTQWKHRVAIQLGSCLGKIGEGLHQGALCFINLIEHGVGSVMLQCNITALCYL